MSKVFKYQHIFCQQELLYDCGKWQLTKDTLIWFHRVGQSITIMAVSMAADSRQTDMVLKQWPRAHNLVHKQGADRESVAVSKAGKTEPSTPSHIRQI